MSTASLPQLILLMTLTQALLAAPIGRFAKRSAAARNAVLLAGTAAMVGADLCFACASSWAGAGAGAAAVSGWPAAGGQNR